MNQFTIIAECGINHNGSVNRAVEMVQKAKEAGADAAKFQLFTERARPRGKEFILSPDAWGLVKAEGDRLGIPVFWSVFDFESVDLARSLGAKWVKLSFVERRNSRLIARCNEVGFERKFVSVDLYHQYSEEDLTGWERLYCPNNGWSGFYPTVDSQVEWAEYADAIRRGKIHGWSDHMVGWQGAAISTALGVLIVEKHFMVDEDCPDAECSLDHQEFALMVRMCRTICERRI